MLAINKKDKEKNQESTRKSKEYFDKKMSRKLPPNFVLGDIVLMHI